MKKTTKRIFTFPQFCTAVNALAQSASDKSNSIFKGVHHDFPPAMLKGDYDAGLSPQETLRRINAEAEAENRAEARMS